MNFGVGQTPDVDEALRLACRQAGLDPRNAVLLRHFANAVFLVDGVVARVAYGQGAVERSARSLAVTQWLATQGYPTCEPVTALHPDLEPVTVRCLDEEIAVSFWVYYPQSSDRPPQFRVLGKLAKMLHQVAGAPPVNLPAYEPLRGLRRVLATPAAEKALEPETLMWLRHRAATLAQMGQTLDSTIGIGMIHGDLYAGNLLNTDDEGRWVLGDWDSVCIGPREVDLAPTAVATRFGLADTHIQQVGDEYGFDIRTWTGFPMLREIRELSTLSALIRLACSQPPLARELDLRIDSLRSGNTTALWHQQ